MSFWSKLAKIAGVAAAPFTGGASAAITAGLGAAGAALGSAADASASNRSTALDYELQRERLDQDRRNAYVQNAIARDAALRSGQSDDARQARQAAFIGGGAQGRPQLSPYYKTADIAREVMESESARAAQLRDRVANAETRLPQVTDPGRYALPESMTRPGTMERIAGWAAPALTAAGAIGRANSAPPSAGYSDPLAELRKQYPGMSDAQLLTVLMAAGRVQS